MADQQKTVAQPSLTGRSFAKMSGAEKLTFIGKACIMLLTGGFAFPNIFVE